jgi:hypothetical protein
MEKIWISLKVGYIAAGLAVLVVVAVLLYFLRRR